MSKHDDGAAHAHHLRYGNDIRTGGFAPSLTDHEGDDHDAATGSPSQSEGEAALLGKPTARDQTQELVDAELRRIHGGRRYIVRRPRALQYFRGTTLVRDGGERASGRLELFFDLTMVGIIAVLAKEAVAEPTGASLVRFLITYTGAYLVWSSMREVFNNFYCDDMYQRFLVMWVMACLIVYGNNAPYANLSLDSDPARAAAIGSYVLAQFGMRLTELAYSFHVKAFRWQLRVYSGLWICAVGLWIGAIFAPLRVCIALSVLALALEYGAWIFCFSPIFRRALGLYYSSASGIDHEIERFNDFFTLVMGEFLFSVFNNQPAGTGLHIKAGRAIMAVVLALCFQLLYMIGSSSKQIVHPIRHSGRRAITWFNVHLPLVCALTLCGDVMAEFVAEELVEQPLRWMLCESYAIGMIGLWVLAMIEADRDEVGDLWIRKSVRLLPRLACALVAALLPLAHQAEPHHGEAGGGEGHALLVRAGGEKAGLTTTKLLGILTALSSVTVLWEQVASLDGPNVASERASDTACNRAEQHDIADSKYLQTPRWRGYPVFFEPGILHVATGSQRVCRDGSL
ncbi:unnamed protein product [Parajaminaea phylloscopi]